MQQPLHVAGMGAAMFGLVFLLISVATVGWMQGKGLNYGLFKICGEDTGICRSFAPEAAEGAVRFFVVVGFLLALIANVVAIYYFVRFVQKDTPNRTLPLVASLELIIAGVCVLLGCIILGTKVSEQYEGTVVPDKPGYSFGLAIVGALACLIAGALIMVERTRSSGSSLN